MAASTHRRDITLMSVSIMPDPGGLDCNLHSRLVIEKRNPRFYVSHLPEPSEVCRVQHVIQEFPNVFM